MKSLALISAFLLSLTSVQAQEFGSLSIEISEIKKQKGDIIILLYSSSDGFPREHEKADFKVKIEKFNKNFSHTFKQVPFGTYAVIVFQDKNENGKMDTKRIIPMPKEPLGISNMKSLGKPNFEKASFSFKEDGAVFVIELLNQ